MQKRFWLAALVAVVLLSGSAVRAEDNFYVIAGGGGGVGTKITSVPYTIFTPGFYYLDRNLVYSGNGNAITIEADNVTLDLMGYSLNYTGPANEPNGIYMLGRKNVEIRNGSISGFWTGIYEASAVDGANHRVINIRADYNAVFGGIGILLTGKNHLVRDCSASNNSYYGIQIEGGTITGCVASDNGEYGISLGGSGSLLDNVVTNTKSIDTTGFEIVYTATVLVDGNSAGGNATNYSIGGTNTVWGVNAGR